MQFRVTTNVHVQRDARRGRPPHAGTLFGQRVQALVPTANLGRPAMKLHSATTTLIVLLLAGALAAQERQMNTFDTNSGTLGNSTTESETSHAVFGNTVVAGWNDTRAVATLGFPGVTSISGFGFSLDGGATWTDGGQLPAPAGQALWGDPAVDVDRNGTFYYVSMSGTPAGAVNGLLAYQSTAIAPAVVFGAPVAIPTLGPAGTTIDKELIAVDKTNGTFDGRVYVAWSEFSSVFDSTSPIVFSRSTSQAPLTFAAATGLAPDDALHQGALPAVAADGTVYVVWGRFDLTGGTPTQIRLRRSTNGGVAFLPVQTIATIAGGPNSLTGAGITHRTRGFPYIAVDRTAVGSPTRGNVYVVFQGDGQGAGDAVDIFMVRSTNSGVTWSVPRCINKAPAVTIGGDTTSNDNWQPSISVSPSTGQITVGFYDRREDTGSADGDPANSRLRLYRANTTDGGLTWFNQPSSSVAVRPAAGSDPLAGGTYMGDYNYAASTPTRVSLSWADFRNPCTPPGGAANPCSPAGRGDQDAFFDGFASLSGPDLFIQPWGHTTGVGPLWQSPDIFVIDASGIEIGAKQGVVNRLRARVKNLGIATATGAVIRFKYAPIFVGLTAGAFKEIGTVTESFNVGQEKVIPIDWDLTDTTDTNGGVWPSPISAFEHFCVKVSVELAADVNQANNNAQNNFDDVTLAVGGTSIFSFLVGNPSEEEAAEFWLDVQLPRGYRVKFPDSEIVANEKFKLGPGEIRLARIQFIAPEARLDPKEDLVADISLMRGDERISGFTSRLAKGRKENRWEVLVERDFEKTFHAVLEVLKKRQERVVQSDPKTGLIQLASIPLTSGQLRELADPKEVATLSDEATGRIVLSFRVLRSLEKLTRIQLGSVLIVDGPQAVIFGGIAVRSRGEFETQHLREIRRVLGL